MAARGRLGLNRQCFFAAIGGFDTHGGDQLQRQAENFGKISGAVTAFQAALTELGLADKVCLFTASDFGRNLPSNGAGTGTDHGWGSHHLVMGGPAPGGRLLSRFPALQVNGPDDAGQGVWIPTTLSAVFPRGGYFDRISGWV